MNFSDFPSLPHKPCLDLAGKFLLRFIGVTLFTWNLPVAEQDFADFRNGFYTLRHITSGAVMPKSAKALAIVCMVAATRRKRAAFTSGSACKTGQAS
jgi:hypothetical protein